MIYKTAFKQGIRPDPDLTITQWADEYRYLPRESSKERGKYRSSRTPWVIEPMDELSPPSSTQKVVVVKPTQFGFTEIGINLLMAVAHMFPGPCLIVFPTEAKATKNSKKRVAPSLEHMPCLNGIIKPVRSRDSGNTILEKDFPGGSWTFTGSNSPVSARHDSIRYLILDDFDGFAVDIGGEGAPGDLFGKRTDSFGNKRKIYINSTLTTKERSNTEKEYEASSKGLFCVPCPHCNEHQYLEFGGKGWDYGLKFKWDEDGQINEVWYICKHCKGRIEEADKEYMLSRGKYIHKYPKRKVRGFKVNALYSPLGWVSWRQIAQEFFDIKGDKARLKVFVNTRLAESFEEEGDQPDWVKLKARCEPYEILTVPEGGLFLTMGTDTQDNRLVTVIRAWGKYEESWLIFYGELWGDPDQAEVWEQHDLLLNRAYKRINGSNLYIISEIIDIGGHKTQAVYNYCRKRAPRVVAGKGMSTPGKPIIGRPTSQDVFWNGETIKNGVQLWPLGVDTAKGIIYGRLNQEKPGSGTYHFPIGTEDDYFLQLTAEKIVTRHIKGFPKPEYVKVRPRNDYLDSEVYAYCAAVRAGMSYMKWDNVREEKKPKTKSQQNKVIARSSWMS